jgi:hypothetical protein
MNGEEHIPPAFTLLSTTSTSSTSTMSTQALSTPAKGFAGSDYPVHQFQPRMSSVSIHNLSGLAQVRRQADQADAKPLGAIRGRLDQFMVSLYTSPGDKVLKGPGRTLCQVQPKCSDGSPSDRRSRACQAGGLVCTSSGPSGQRRSFQADFRVRQEAGLQTSEEGR